MSSPEGDVCEPAAMCVYEAGQPALLLRQGIRRLVLPTREAIDDDTWPALQAAGIEVVLPAAEAASLVDALPSVFADA